MSISGRAFFGLSLFSRQPFESAWSQKALVMSKKRKKIIELLRQGKAAYRKKKFEEARTFFTNVLLIDENHPVALANRSMTFF